MTRHKSEAYKEMNEKVKKPIIDQKQDIWKKMIIKSQDSKNRPVSRQASSLLQPRTPLGNQEFAKEPINQAQRIPKISGPNLRQTAASPSKHK